MDLDNDKDREIIDIEDEDENNESLNIYIETFFDDLDGSSEWIELKGMLVCSNITYNIYIFKWPPCPQIMPIAG